MVRLLIIRGVALVWAFAALQAQSLSIQSSTVKRGSSSSFLLTFEAAPGKGLLALQWEFTFPPNVVVETGDIVAGSAVESAKKTLTCAPVVKYTGPGSAYGCILFGGLKPVGNGPVAAVRYRVPLEVQRIAGKISARKIVGVAENQASIRLEATQAEITVK